MTYAITSLYTEIFQSNAFIYTFQDPGIMSSYNTNSISKNFNFLKYNFGYIFTAEHIDFHLI